MRCPVLLPLPASALRPKKSGLGLGIGGSGLGLDLVLSGLVYFACFIHSQVMRPVGCNFLIPVTGNKVYVNGFRERGSLFKPAASMHHFIHCLSEPYLSCSKE